MWLLLVQINLTVKMVFLIAPLVSCTVTENITSTEFICWVQLSNETHQLETRCNNCTQCPEGTYIVEPCTKTTDTVCRECPVGSYSAREDSTNCLRCTDCAEYGKSNVMECSRTEDTICVCPTGTFLKNGTCVACSKCPPGNQVSKSCGNDTDTECTTCRPGSFSDQENSQPYCQACNVCYRNRIEIQRCSATTNTICGECKEGYYKEDNTADCAKCSYCYPEFPGYTFPVERCLGIMHDPNYTCMPVTVPPYLGVIGNEIDVSSVMPLKISVWTSTEDSIEDTTITSLMYDIEATRSVASVPIIVIIVILIVFLLVIVIIFRFRRRKHNKNSGSSAKHKKHNKNPGSSANHSLGILNRIKLCFMCANSAKRHKLISQPSKESTMESGEELDESNAPNMLPCSERNKNMIESEVESDASNRPNVGNEYTMQTMDMDSVESDASNRPNVGNEYTMQTVEVDSVESNGSNVRPLRKELGIGLQPTKSETEAGFYSIQSYDSGFSEEEIKKTMNELEKDSVIETDLGTSCIVPDFGPEHLLDINSIHTNSEPIVESILYLDGKETNPAVFCV